MSLMGIANLGTAGIVSTQKKELPKWVLQEQPRKDDTVDKFIKQKADEAKEVPVGDRNAKNWAALAADFVKNTLMKPTVVR